MTTFYWLIGLVVWIFLSWVVTNVMDSGKERMSLKQSLIAGVFILGGACFFIYKLVNELNAIS